MRILLIEDEKYMAEAIAHVLKKNNYSVDLAHDGEEGLNWGLLGIHDLIILDIMLPKRDGISVLKELRQEDIAAPVILLTAKGQTEDKIIGLDSGADDYMAKPFPTEELLARLRALGRRNRELANEGVLAYGDVELNPYNLSLRCRKEELILTLKECQLLELLIKNQGMTLSKETILEKVWGYDTDASDNHVEVYISFLRKKLKNLQSNVAIQTLRGVGYTTRVNDDV